MTQNRNKLRTTDLTELEIRCIELALTNYALSERTNNQLVSITSRRLARRFGTTEEAKITFRDNGRKD